MIALLIGAQFTYAAPGDTTWVQAHNTQFDLGGMGYGNYDTMVAFPDGTKTYRKVLMYFNLGIYNCPAGSQYCHQWDYDVHTYIMPDHGDTVEMARFITPFATSGTPRFAGNWSKDYVFDVTDFYPLLKDSQAVRILYSGYSAGFKGNVRFAFIEGTPERNVVGISKIYQGSYQYGNANNPISNNVTLKSRTAPANTTSADFRFLVTGHGSDAQGCCEFASHNYQVKLNGTQIADKAIWRNDCGVNDLYPQGGTWIYDRANWCPGNKVDHYTHSLPGVGASSSYNLEVTFDPYTNTNTNYGSYSISGVVFYYGDFNHTVDAELKAIVAPTVDDDYFRSNQSNDKPIVKVHNAGSDTITSILFEYGVKDSLPMLYTWTGNLPSKGDTTITLETLPTLKNLSLAGVTTNFDFSVKILEVNGAVDGDSLNNELASTFAVAPKWPSTIVVRFNTNSQGTGGINQGLSENSWTITDINGNIVASRTNAATSTLYVDTVHFPHTGFYQLKVTDLSCDGLHWWPYDQNPNYGVTAGALIVRQLNGSNIPMKGYQYSGTFRHDFGCEFVQNFTATAAPVSIDDAAKIKVGLDVFPNPAKHNIEISVFGPATTEGIISVIDLTGRKVLQQNYTGGKMSLDVSGLAAGMYQVLYQNTKDASLKSAEKLTIIK